MEAKNKAVETFLPVFSGFYNTFWQFQDDDILYSINQDRDNIGLSPIEWDCLEFNYPEYEIDTVQGVILELNDILSAYVDKIEFQKIQSPKTYNFKNDSVDVLITPKIDKIKSFIYANMEDFKLYLKNRYTSYDGFLSHYSNNVEDWKEYTDNFTDYGGSGHYLGSVLEFICQKNNIEELDIYYHVKENISEWEYITNYELCNNSLSCSKCNKLINDKETTDQAVKYKGVMGFYPSIIHCVDCIN